jgi:hypothetical protein
MSGPVLPHSLRVLANDLVYARDAHCLVKNYLRVSLRTHLSYCAHEAAGSVQFGGFPALPAEGSWWHCIDHLNPVDGGEIVYDARAYTSSDMPKHICER